MDILIDTFDLIEDFVFILDEKTNIIFANRYSQNKLGYTLDELKKRSIQEVYPVVLRDEVLRIVLDTLTGISKTYTLPLISKNGEYFHVETRVKYIITWIPHVNFVFFKYQ